MTEERDEQGQVTLLIIGFAGILLMAIVVVIDASAAYLQRQGLDNLADGAALYGADLGSAAIYEQGLGDARLLQQEAAVKAAVRDYLARANAGSRFPGIDVDPNVLFVDAGNGIFTSAGTAAGIDLCLHIVRLDHGAEVANKVARRMVAKYRESLGIAPSSARRQGAGR